MHRLLNICICLFAAYIYAQNKNISGNIKDNENRNAVHHANVVISDLEDNILGFSFTDESGYFVIEIPEEINKIYINITALNYMEFFSEHDLTTGTKFILFLEPSMVELEEVVITARAYRDVLNLDLNDLNLNKTASLRDILSKTDGVIVSKDGTISYQGKLINKILINGKEVFINQNKVALDNLNYEIMDTLQIINNFKDRFSLDYSGQKESVINIKTKSEFKGVLKSEIEAGYGFKNSYRFYGKGFFFSDKLNVFATAGINNIGQRDIGEKEISPKVFDNLSRKFNTTLNPFLMEDYQMNKNISSSMNLTLRWEGNKNKIGLVFNNVSLNTKRELYYSSSEGNQLLRQGTLNNSNKGNFYAATLNYDHIISSKMILNNVFNFIVLKNNSLRNTEDVILYPQDKITAEDITLNPRNIALTNNLKLSSVLSEKSLIDFSFDFYHEKDKNSLNTKLENSSVLNVLQKELYLRNSMLFLGNHQLRLKKNTFNSGIGIKLSKEKSDQALDEFGIISQQTLKRNIKNIETRFSLTGTLKKFEYYFSFSPTFFFTNSNGNRSFLKTNNHLTYNFQPQNNLTLSFERYYKFFDINDMFDTIIQSFNNRTINSFFHLEQFSHTNQASVGWYYIQASKNKSFTVEYKFKQEKHILQTVLDSISENTFFYSNRIFDKNHNHTINFRANKSFYLGESYHLLMIGPNFKFMRNDYNTLLDNIFSKVSITTWNPEIHIGFLPRNSFIKELKNTTGWNQQNFRINHNEITTQKTFSNTFSIRGHNNRIEWSLDLIYNHYNTYGNDFGVPDLSVFLKYDLTEKTSVSVNGKSILSLFELNNFKSIHTQSDGNIITQTSTQNNLGYLIFNLSYKM